jgi:hypothetical protein
LFSRVQDFDAIAHALFGWCAQTRVDVGNAIAHALFGWCAQTRVDVGKLTTCVKSGQEITRQ